MISLPISRNLLYAGYFFMKKKLIEFNLNQRAKKIPDLKAGDIVKITRKIKEGAKEISQTFEGIIIAIKGKQSSSPMITVRKVSHSVGVELILPLYSPNIAKIVLVKRAKVRRAKLYYIREKSVKSLKMKYKDLSKFAKMEEEAKPEEKAEIKEEDKKEEK
jgi:large subunit ribosomal protein L19